MNARLDLWVRTMPLPSALSIALLLLAFAVEIAKGAITFTPGHIYASNYDSRTISEYASNGLFLGSLTLPPSAGDEVRGMAFGPDGLLYATVVRGLGGAVLALQSDGAIQQTYPFNTYVNGNLSHGKLAVNSTNIYVGGQELWRFQIGNPASGTAIYTKRSVFDVEILPSGNLFVAWGDEVHEITSAGVFVREVGNVSFTDIRGLEYDSSTNKLFVTHLGHTNFFDRLMRIDATSGTLESNTSFHYADDLFLTMSGELIVGSRTQIPRFYSQALVQGAPIGSSQQMFVTQFVPEPNTINMVIVALLSFGTWLRGSRAAG
jgi:hypothetical protein